MAHRPPSPRSIIHPSASEPSAVECVARFGALGQLIRGDPRGWAGYSCRNTLRRAKTATWVPRVRGGLAGMIVWSGWGFVVALIMTVWVGVVAAVGYTPRPRYLVAIALGAALAAGLNYAFARYIDRGGERVLIDPATGQQVVLRRRDSLFFIPVRYWTWIILGLGALLVGLEATK